MKFVIVALSLVALAAASPAGKYTTKYDDINVDEILSNSRILNQYYSCLMGDGKCTAEGSELKKILPDALTTKCGGCSEKQKKEAEKIVRHMYEKEPDKWNKLEEKYDPKHLHRVEFGKELKEKYGVDIEKYPPGSKLPEVKIAQ